MNLKDAIATGKPIKYKTHTWFWRPSEIPAYLIKAADDNWEVVDEIPEHQLDDEAKLKLEAQG